MFVERLGKLVRAIAARHEISTPFGWARLASGYLKNLHLTADDKLAGMTGTVMRSGGAGGVAPEAMDDELEFMASSVESGIGSDMRNSPSERPTSASTAAPPSCAIAAFAHVTRRSRSTNTAPMGAASHADCANVAGGVPPAPSPCVRCGPS